MGNSRFGALPARWEFHRGDRKQTASMHLLVRVCRISHLYLCIRGPRGFLWKIERGILPLFRGWGGIFFLPLLLSPPPFIQIVSSFRSCARSIYRAVDRGMSPQPPPPQTVSWRKSLKVASALQSLNFNIFLHLGKYCFLSPSGGSHRDKFFGKFVLVCLANRFRHRR